MREAENLNCKPIWEFTEEDTIYIKDSRIKTNSILRLCKFVKVKSNYVTGIPIDIVESHYTQAQNKEPITAHITNCALYGKNPVTEHTSFNWFKGSGYAVYPQEYELGSENPQVPKTHPSYGMIGISRVTGRTNLFGTSIQHIDYFSLKIGRAEHERSLSNDWYYKRDNIIEVCISSTQFTDLITGMNRGDGIPCTIKYIDGEYQPEPPFISQLDLASAEFKNKMKSLSEPLDADIEIIKDLLSGKTVTKSQREEIIKILDRYSSTINNSIPYVEKQLGESMNRTVSEAKSAVESFISTRITEAGVEALQKQAGGKQILIGDLNRPEKDEGDI